MKKIILFGIALACFFKLSAQPNPVACYNFSGNLNEANGGTPLTAINGLGTFSTGPGICTTDSFYSWVAGQGLDLVIGSVFPTDNYTIELLFTFTSVPPQAWWQRILDFKSNTEDLGLYIYNDQVANTFNLQMYLQNTGTSNIAQPNTWFRLFLTRDAATDTVKGYINNNLEIVFKDDLAAGKFNTDLILFKDDIVVQNEESAGTIDYMRIYDKPLTFAEIQQIVTGSTPSIVITGDTTICKGDSTVLTASGGSFYTWSTGETTNSITVGPTSDTKYSVSGWGYQFCTKTCVNGDTVLVTVSNGPTANAGIDDTIAAGASYTLNGTGGKTYA